MSRHWERRVPSRGAIGLVVAALILVGVTGCGSGSTTTVTVTSPAATSSTAATSSSTTAATTSSAAAAAPQSFSGTGSENIGTITVPTDSTLTWTCDTCGNANFQIFNAATDSGTIGVNGLDQTSGRTVISAGTYHGVTINTEGQNWSLLIGAGNSTQAPTTPAATTPATTTSTTTPTTTSAGPLATVNTYWRDVNAGDFAGTYATVASGWHGGESETTFAANEQREGIESARFSGAVGSMSGGIATVDVTSLIVQSAANGCQNWSGYYRLTHATGAWLIELAEITPQTCPG